MTLARRRNSETDDGSSMTGPSYHDDGASGHAHDHTHGHGHAHAAPPATARAARALAWALGLTLLFAGVEAVGGLVAGSLALLADAAHMLMDSGALALSLFAAWIARRPASAARTYGWKRVEILAALVNGALLLVVTGGIVVEAIRRLGSPQPIQTGLMLGVASAGFAANLAAAALLHQSRDENLNVRGAYLHVLSDLAGSVAAIIAAIVIRMTGWLPADPLLSLALSLLLIVSALRLLMQAVDVLLEAAPRHVDVTALEAAVAGVPGVERVHDVHVWTVSSGFVAMSGHAVVPDAGRAQEALEEITRRVQGFGIRHVTVQLEGRNGRCIGCDG
jgi:cobalt-zinc-cadmium efflux system protein